MKKIKSMTLDDVFKHAETLPPSSMSVEELAVQAAATKFAGKKVRNARIAKYLLSYCGYWSESMVAAVRIKLKGTK